MDFDLPGWRLQIFRVVFFFLFLLLSACVKAEFVGQNGPSLSPAEESELIPDSDPTPMILPPTLAEVSPQLGPLTGGGWLVVRGSHFPRNASVTVGGLSCDEVVWNTSLQLSCRLPVGSPGVKDVVVSGPNGIARKNGAYEYVMAPTLAEVIPDRASLSGGQRLTLRGNGFRFDAAVTVGGAVCAERSVVSAEQLHCQLPARSAGAQVVVVTTPGGEAHTIIRYVTAPQFTQVSPAVGPLSGGSSVTITGDGFESDTSVEIGGIPCAAVQVLSATQLRCVPAPSGQGAKTLRITTVGGTVEMPSAYRYESLFVSTWKTDHPGRSSADQVKLPLITTGAYDFTVYWGDGTENRIAAWDSPHALHTYPAPGTYQIWIQGTFSGLMLSASGDAQKILTIGAFGPVRLGNGGSYFASAKNLTITATDAPDLTGTTNFYAAFQGCASLTSVPSLASWNVSQVTNMNRAFEGATLFNQNIESWNTASVTTMQQMFKQASAFNQPLARWNTSRVTDLSQMFYEASAFNQPLDLWDTSQVTTLEKTFYQARSFNSAVNGWNTARVTNMFQTFQAALNFNQPLSGWVTSSVTNMGSMFWAAYAFDQPLNSWDVRSVTTMRHMFVAASVFNQPLDRWDTSSVNEMTGMFVLAKAFNQPIGGWNTSSVQSMENMFGQTDAFNQPIGSWDTSRVRNMRSVFHMAKAFNQPIGNWDVSMVTDFTGMFSTTGSFNQPLSNWNTANATDMSFMFNNAAAFNQPLDRWNVSQVRRMRRMFLGAGAFNQSLAGWTPTSLDTADDFLTASPFGNANYDLTLVAWSRLSLRPNVTISFGAAKYFPGASASARQVLVSSPNLWTLSDGGGV